MRILCVYVCIYMYVCVRVSEARKIGKYAAVGQLPSSKVANSRPRCYTDVTRNLPGHEVHMARGDASLCAHPSDEAQTKLVELRQARLSARTLARAARERAQSRSRLAPGEDTLVAARKTIQLARAAREHTIKQQQTDKKALFNSYYEP